MVTFTQLMSHYINEYYDQESDRINQHRTWFSGGSGVLKEGRVSAGLVLRVALTCLCLACIFSIIGGVYSLWLGIVGATAIFGGWFYSAPPLRGVRAGWGELSASVVVATLTPLVGCISQTRGPLPSLFLPISLSLTAIHFAMLLAFEMPDAPSDERSGKRTLTVRVGLRRAVWLHHFALLFASILWIGFLFSGFMRAIWLCLLLPVMIYQVVQIENYRHQGFSAPSLEQKITFTALALFALSGVLWFPALWL